MHYLFNEEITEESVNSLVEKLNSAEKDEKINLWFATNGGESSSMGFLVNYFNSIKDKLTITLTDRILSAGTSILTDFNGKVVLDLDDLDVILFHVADRESYRFRKDSTFHDAKILSKQDKEYNLNFAEKIKKKNLLTEKQLKQFLKGRDVVVYKEQFKTWKL
jgi:hypothetical protein